MGDFATRELQVCRPPVLLARFCLAHCLTFRLLLQECGSKVTVRASVSEPDCTVPSLYDQLLQLKDWTEERAELCAASPERQVMLCS